MEKRDMWEKGIYSLSNYLFLTVSSTQEVDKQGTFLRWYPCNAFETRPLGKKDPGGGVCFAFFPFLVWGIVCLPPPGLDKFSLPPSCFLYFLRLYSEGGGKSEDIPHM